MVQCNPYINMYTYIHIYSIYVYNWLVFHPLCNLKRPRALFSLLKYQWLSIQPPASVKGNWPLVPSNDRCRHRWSCTPCSATGKKNAKEPFKYIPNKYPLYKLFLGLTIKDTVPRLPPYSLWKDQICNKTSSRWWQAVTFLYPAWRSPFQPLSSRIARNNTFPKEKHTKNIH